MLCRRTAPGWNVLFSNRLCSQLYKTNDAESTCCKKRHASVLIPKFQMLQWAQSCYRRLGLPFRSLPFFDYEMLINTKRKPVGMKSHHNWHREAAEAPRAGAPLFASQHCHFIRYSDKPVDARWLDIMNEVCGREKWGQTL